MKQLITKILLAHVCFFVWPSFGQASEMTTSPCSACHVMHASQYNPLSEVIDSFTPSASLLKTSCEGCHGGISGTLIGPAVYNSPTDLAGGDFAYSLANHRMGHNPKEILAGEDLSAPPGWNASFPDSAGNQVAWVSGQFSCAGKYGCHGNHSITNGILSLQKAHHNNSTGAVEPVLGSGATVGGSYRFLHGIKGYEDSVWEASISATNRNVYYDKVRSSDLFNDMNKQTISYLCAQCHGNFHSGTGSPGLIDETTDTIFVDPWIRHPVGVDMPTTGDYANYTLINDGAPVASSTSPIINPGTHNTNISGTTNRIIMCLSCHRAHASQYYASMRWDYRGTPGTTVSGCSVCHSSKQ